MAIDPQDKSFPASSGASASGSGLSAGGNSSYGGGASGGSTSGSGTSGAGGTMGQGGANEQVQRVAQGAHQAVDRVQESLTAGTDKLMAMQQEYGDMARERVTDNPFAALGIAFAAGIVLSEVVLPSRSSASKRRARDDDHVEDRHSRTESLGRGLRRWADLERGPLHDVATSASHAAHRLERQLGRGGDKLMAMQHEYGGMARDQIKAHPLLLLGIGLGVCAAVLKFYDESR